MFSKFFCVCSHFIFFLLACSPSAIFVVVVCFYIIRDMQSGICVICNFKGSDYYLHKRIWPFAHKKKLIGSWKTDEIV